MYVCTLDKIMYTLMSRISFVRSIDCTAIQGKASHPLKKLLLFALIWF